MLYSIQYNANFRINDPKIEYISHYKRQDRFSWKEELINADKTNLIIAIHRLLRIKDQIQIDKNWNWITNLKIVIVE